jgi:hypothetical protein
MAKGIRRYLELILDRKAAKEMEREAQDALQKGTDPKKPEQNIGRVEKAFHGLKSAAVKLGAALLAAFALNKIRQFGQESWKAAEELVKGQRALEQQLRNVGTAWSDVRGEIKETADALWETHRLTGGEVDQVLRQLITVTGDYEKSLRNVGLAADIAAAFQMNAEGAAKLLGRVMQGDTAILKRYGIVVAEGADAVQVLIDRVGGMAKATTTPTQALQKAFGDLKEEIGLAMMEAGNGTSVMDTLIGTVRGLTRWISDNGETIQWWANGAVGVMAWAGQEIATVFQRMRRDFEQIRGWYDDFIDGIQRRNAIVLNFIAKVTGKPREEFWGSGAGGTWGEEKTSTTKTPPRVSSAPGGTGGTGGQQAAQEMMREYAATIATLAPQIVGPAVRDGMIGAMDNDESRRRMAAAAGVWIDVNHSMIHASQNAAMGVMGVWSDAFESIIRDGQNMGAAMEEIGRGMAGALLGGMAQLAAAKVAENIARSIEGIGIGLTGNPAGFAAAKVFAVAAAKWAAFGALAGAAQSVVSGGGRGGVSGGIPSGAYDPAGRIMDRAAGPGAEIHIQVDGIDPLNPRHQNLLHHTAKSAGERYGGTVFVNGRRR